MWVTRDKNGELCLFKYKPSKYTDVWLDPYTIYLSLGKDSFPEVKWEDDEPTEVELIIKQK